MWGRQLPSDKGEAVRSWGARAIFQGGRVDLLPDRQQYVPADGDVEWVPYKYEPAFIHWLNTKGLPWLRENVGHLASDSQEEVRLEDDRYLLVASPQGSCGYLYIGAAEYPGKNVGYELSEPPEGVKWGGNYKPELGQRVLVTMNKFGEGTIVSFFHEHGYLGVRVKLDHQPDWHRDQGQPPYVLVFGPETCLLAADNASLPA